MRWGAVLVMLAGCNWAFGLAQTEPIDGETKEFFDAMPDAPFACPPIGTTPRFSPFVHQVITQSCNTYSFNRASGLAIASCGLEIKVGPIDSPLVAEAGLVGPDPSWFVYEPKRTPEGDRVYATARKFITGSFMYRTLVFAKSGGQWSPLPDFMPVGASDFPHFFGITAGPSAHLAVTKNYELYEYVADGSGGWTELPSYTGGDLAVVPYSGSMSEDGLRLIISGSELPSGDTGVFYTDRADVSSRFRKAERMATLPPDLQNPFLSDDCARVYFSGFGAIFYFQQQ